MTDGQPWEADIFENGVLIEDRFWMGSPGFMLRVLERVFGRAVRLN